MKQVLVSRDGVTVHDVPAPMVEPGTVLVQTIYSCISAGTELSGIRSISQPLWKRIAQQPEKVKQVWQQVASEGLAKTRGLVKRKLSAAHPTGYSLYGNIIAVGSGIDDLSIGDRVACGGAQFAQHAEIVRVPRNLVVAVPHELDDRVASTVTLGAIALQGIRRAEPTMGETFVVIGLGLLGQITARMLRASGVRVIGSDLNQARMDVALAAGMDMALPSGDGADASAVARLTDGHGADGVIITASTPSDDVVSTAFRMCRRRGRVVLVGDVGLNIDRQDIYTKELDFRVSTSYGPGRYDRRYEEEGLDYPIGYVRWTENRNMAEYLRLLAEDKVSIDDLLGTSYQIDNAAQAYAALGNPGTDGMLSLLEYPTNEKASLRRLPNPSACGGNDGTIRVALVGAGGFAKDIHLPIIGDNPHSTLHAVVSRQGHNARETAEQCGATYASTDINEVLDDPDVDALVIATRHDLHGDLALRALHAGKHVLVEKPLCLTEKEMGEIALFYQEAGDTPPVLLTGFNRRFSPPAMGIHKAVRDRASPMMMNYRVNAGYLPPDMWVHGAEGGGRNLGEACHFYDLFVYLTGSRPSEVQALSLRPQSAYYRRDDNFSVTVSFEDGSVATLTYTALGAKDYPKERLDVYVDGKVFALDNFTSVQPFGTRDGAFSASRADKGHAEQWAAFTKAIRLGGDWPSPLWQQMSAMQIAFDVQRQIVGS